MTHSCPDCAKVGAGLLQSLNAGAMLKKSRGLGQSPSSNSVVPMFTTPLSLFRAPYHPYAPALTTSPAALKLPTRTLVRPLTNGGESPPVPPFLRNARRGKTPEGLSRRSVTEPASAAKPWRAQEESDFWCLSSEQAFRTSRFGEGGDAPANAGTQRRKGVYELRTVIYKPLAGMHD